MFFFFARVCYCQCPQLENADGHRLMLPLVNVGILIKFVSFLKMHCKCRHLYNDISECQ